MANVIAYYALNIGNINLNNVESYVQELTFFDDQPYSYGLPVSFQDQIELYYGDGTLAFAGTGLTI